MSFCAVFSAICMWIAFVLGTVLSLAIAIWTGPAKVCPCHPANRAQSYGFSNVYGPFFNKACPGTVLRFATGISEIVAGIGILIALWGDAFGWFGDYTADAAKAWCMCALCGVLFITGAASVIEYDLDHKIGKAGILAGLSFVTLVLRVFYFPPWDFLFHNQVLVWVFGFTVPWCFCCAATLRRFTGPVLNDLDPANDELKDVEAGKA